MVNALRDEGSGTIKSPLGLGTGFGHVHGRQLSCRGSPVKLRLRVSAALWNLFIETSIGSSEECTIDLFTINMTSSNSRGDCPMI